MKNTLLTFIDRGSMLCAFDASLATCGTLDWALPCLCPLRPSFPRTPVPGVANLSGFFYCLSNRAIPAGNAPAPQRRIRKRVENHGPLRFDNREGLKNPAASGDVTTAGKAVTHADDTAIGLEAGSPVSREGRKAPIRLPKERMFWLIAYPARWFAICNPPEQPKELKF